MDTTFFDDLRAAVTVQADATVSKVVYSDDRIRVVAFAFDTGQELTEHTARLPIVVQVIEGLIDFEAAGVTRAMAPGSWIHLPADAPHSVIARQPTVMLLTLLKG